jgi:hypothetical protein
MQTFGLDARDSWYIEATCGALKRRRFGIHVAPPTLFVPFVVKLALRPELLSEPLSLLPSTISLNADKRYSYARACIRSALVRYAVDNDRNPNHSHQIDFDFT